MNKEAIEKRNKSIQALVFLLFSSALEQSEKFTDFMTQQVLNARRGLQ